MVKLKLEAADIFRRHGARWRAANGAHLGLAQRRVMTAIERIGIMRANIYFGVSVTAGMADGSGVRTGGVAAATSNPLK